MGIVILPILAAAIMIFVIAIIRSIKLLNSGIIGLNEIIFGLIISLILFASITISYIIEKKIWGLSPYFRVSLFTLFIPFVVYLGIKNSDSQNILYYSHLLLISIVISGILGVAFNYVVFELLEYFNVKKYY